VNSTSLIQSVYHIKWSIQKFWTKPLNSFGIVLRSLYELIWSQNYSCVAVNRGTESSQISSKRSSFVFQKRTKVLRVWNDMIFGWTIPLKQEPVYTITSQKLSQLEVMSELTLKSSMYLSGWFSHVETRLIWCDRHRFLWTFKLTN